jgi:hypothetical protein
LAFSYWTDKPSFLTEGKLAVVLITPSLGVPNWSVIYIINTAPSTHCKESSLGSPTKRGEPEMTPRSRRADHHPTSIH